MQLTGENYVKYQNNGQVGAMGDNARVDSLAQSLGTSQVFDYAALLDELKALRSAVDEDPGANQDEKDHAIATIHQAKEAATQRNEAGVVASLKKSSKWLIHKAQDLGLHVIAIKVAHQI